MNTDRVLVRTKSGEWFWGWWLEDGMIVNDEGKRFGFRQVVSVYGGDIFDLIEPKSAKEAGEMLEEIFGDLKEGEVRWMYGLPEKEEDKEESR